LPSVRREQYFLHLYNSLTSVLLFDAVAKFVGTALQFAGSIPDGVIGIFHSVTRSGRIVSTVLTHPVTYMSTRSNSLG
jgi:hypothetical protein